MADHLPSLQEQAARLPQRPGVYLMRDRHGTVIYVGKAKSLRTRVRSYFRQTADTPPKTRLMMRALDALETIVTPTEKDALILENNLIKRYRPRYNVIFRDDKEYPYLMLDVEAAFPRLRIVRRPRRDGSVYFGPFASGQAVRETLRIINRLFPLRKCRSDRHHRARACLYAELGQCLAPCVNPGCADQYRKTVHDVQLFLQGRSDEIRAALQQRMEAKAAALQFEDAARLRDQITALEQTLARQTVVCLDGIDRDVFGAYCDEGQMNITTLFVRSGRVLGKRNIFIRRLAIPAAEALASIIAQYYQQGAGIPPEIIVAAELDDLRLLEEMLSDMRGGPVSIRLPRRGLRRELGTMAVDNARESFQASKEQEAGTERTLDELRQLLHLPHRPERIECFDISTIMGTAAVGAMSVMQNGAPLKSAYRRYRIKTVGQADDYAMLAEVLGRRLDSLKESEPLPDLILVDGGRGHLNVLQRELDARQLDRIAAASIAKGPERNQAKRLQQEQILLPGRKNPVTFPHNARALFLLQRIRDESHRFAVDYHRSLKRSIDLQSSLEQLPGIGTATVKNVLRAFGTLDAVRAADRSQLLAVPGMTRSRAQTLYAHFHPHDTGTAADGHPSDTP